MAVLTIVDNPCDSDLALKNLCEYIIRWDRTCGNVGGRGVRPAYAYEDFCCAQELWRKMNGRRAYHLVLSFDDLDAFVPSDAIEIAMRFSDLFFPTYQVLFGVHTEQAHLHIHFAVNPVSLETGLKLHLGFEELRQLRAAVDHIIEAYKASILG